MNLRRRFFYRVAERALLVLAISLIPFSPATASEQQEQPQQQPVQPQQQQAPPRPAPTQGPMTLIGRYHGVLPCADCSGIDTDLALYAKSAHEFVNTRYVMKLTYQKGKGPGKTFGESGTWAVLRGTPEDPNATVYQLTSSKNGQVMNFLKIGANQLESLDKDQHRIETNMPHTLTRVLPSQRVTN